MNIIQIYGLVILLLSVVIHEVSHGLMALRLGDETAKNAGRLTLNPISHLDMVGSIIVPILSSFGGFPFGWAKPVPYDPRNLYKDYKYGPLKVALAGPGANFAVAVIVGLITRFAVPFISPFMAQLLILIVGMNIFLGLLNLIPVPPLDGSKILIYILPQKYSYKIQSLGVSAMFLALLAFFVLAGPIAILAGYLTSLIIGA